MNSRITKNYLYSVSYQLLVFFAPLATMPYISRTLGAAGVGTYSYCYSLTAYFSIFAALGLQVYGQIHTARCRDNRERLRTLFWNIMGAKLLTTAVAFALFICFIVFFSEENKIILYILSINTAATFFDITWFYQGLEEFKRPVLRNFIVRLSSMALIFLLVKEPGDLWKYTLIMHGSVLIGNFSLWAGLDRYVGPVRAVLTKPFSIIKESLFYFIPTLANTLYAYLDRTMLGILTGAGLQSGYYEQAVKVESVVLTLISALSIVIMPRIAYLEEEGKRGEIRKLLTKSSRIILLFALPIGAGLALVADNFVHWFSGEEFRDAVPVFRLFGIMLLVGAVKDFFGTQILLPFKREKKYSVILLAGVLLNLAVNMLLIPRYGALGAAAASLFAEAFVAFLFIFCCRDIFSVRSALSGAWRYAVAAAVMAVVVLLIKTLPVGTTQRLLLQVVGGALVYLLVLVLLRDRTLHDAFG